MLHRFWASIQNDWLTDVSWRNSYPHRIWNGVEILWNKLKRQPLGCQKRSSNMLISAKWDMRLPSSVLAATLLLLVSDIITIAQTRWIIWSQSVTVRVVGWTQFPGFHADLSEHRLSCQGQAGKDSCWDSFAWCCTETYLMVADHINVYSHVYVETGRNFSDCIAQLLRMGSYLCLDSTKVAEKCCKEIDCSFRLPRTKTITEKLY